MRTFRRHRPSMAASLAVVSLMDIFTIILLFLLTSATGETQVIPKTELLKLPSSTSELQPKATLLIMITQQDVIVEGKPVATVEEAIADPELLLPALFEEMTYQAEKAKFLAGQTDGVFLGTVSIMAHKTLPFRLLEKVLFTCAQAEFGNISLSVLEGEKKTTT